MGSESVLNAKYWLQLVMHPLFLKAFKISIFNWAWFNIQKITRIIIIKLLKITTNETYFRFHSWLKLSKTTPTKLKWTTKVGNLGNALIKFERLLFSNHVNFLDDLILKMNDDLSWKWMAILSWKWIMNLILLEGCACGGGALTRGAVFAGGTPENLMVWRRTPLSSIYSYCQHIQIPAGNFAPSAGKFSPPAGMFAPCPHDLTSVSV